MALRNAFDEVARETTQSVDVADLLHSILIEMRKMNAQLEQITDMEITDEEVEHERY